MFWWFMIRSCQNDILGQFINTYKNNEKTTTKMFIWTFLRTMKFQFQIVNISKLCKFIKCVKRKNTKSPWESYFWKFEIRHIRSAGNDNENPTFFFVYYGKHAKSLKNLRIYLQIEMSKTHFYIYNRHWWNLACENMQ